MLTADEHALLRSHLDGCAECRAELMAFRAIAANLPVTLDTRLPSPKLRDRIETAVRASSNASAPLRGTWQNVTAPESVPTAVPTAVPTMVRMPGANDAPAPKRRSLPNRNRYVWATAALVLLALLAGALAGRMLLADDGEDAAQGETIALQMNPPIPNATGELKYMPVAGVFKLTMHNMPAAPHDHVYQVWMIEDDVPVPVGMVDQTSGEFAVAAERSEYDMLAITVEPAPLGSQTPTTPPIITAPLENSTDS